MIHPVPTSAQQAHNTAQHGTALQSEEGVRRGRGRGQQVERRRNQPVDECTPT